MRRFLLKYELLNNEGLWQEFTEQVVGTTTINLGNIAEVGSEDFGIDSLKKFANLIIHNAKNKKLTTGPILSTNQFQLGRRVRIKVRTAKSTNHYNLSQTGEDKAYILLKNIKRVEEIELTSIYDGVTALTPSEANLNIENTSQMANGLYVYFNRVVKPYEKVGFLVITTASDLDADRVEFEGTGAREYFIPNVDPDVVELLGYYKYSYLPWAIGYFSRNYFSDTYGVEYLYFAKEDDPENFPYYIESVTRENGGIRIRLNTEFPVNQRMVVGLFFNAAEDIIIFDGKIKRYEGIGYHNVSLECQDFSYDLDVMAINKTYSKGITFEATIEQILKDNNRADIEFLYDPTNTAILTEDYIVEDVTIWDSIQKLALTKGWSLYFRYDRTKNKQVLIFEDTISASYITYQLLKGEVIGEFTYTGDLTRVRNIVTVIYKDHNDGNKVKTIEIKDDDSILKYRENRLTLGLDVTEKVITTNDMAMRMATQALKDLKDPVVNYTIETTLMPKLKLNDELWYIHENLTERPLFLRAYSIEHAISVDDAGELQCTTTITGGGKIQYKLNEWLYNDSKVQEDKEIIIV
ncbi:MAG: hypothetical protein HUJ87_14120 [Fusobacterium varium]|uniref:hypothetical protein n=1 Tax=Fusobacterium varium TaxID=856 RepID=UPI0018999DFF|nr:hypothetical protein [Fusobacterium varium]MCF0171626.1 hypothetical protein [Fusobacterium varium]DAK06684.1 MAG TPA: endopeptidase tail [Caudoviricetes sp.]